ncbi:MAG: hypothetical protein L6R38_008824 [Xanthoria sp. 2 TBL-2021]|nr:MAG: hypothetical protein L6R38_008824 [Xanthoria sp. 2 TBL-2021]
MVSTSYPPYPLWPTNPPRPSIYVSTFALTYPFVTPALAHFHAYKGFLPIWFAVSKEQFVDGAKVIARRAVERGVRIELVRATEIAVEDGKEKDISSVWGESVDDVPMEEVDRRIYTQVGRMEREFRDAWSGKAVGKL